MTIEGHIVRIEFDGLFDLPEYEIQRQVMDEVRASQGRVYVLALTAKANSMTAPVRQKMSQYLREHSIGGVANVAANMIARGIATLVHNGIELIYGPTAPLKFCQTEDEARAWIAELDRAWLTAQR